MADGDVATRRKTLHDRLTRGFGPLIDVGPNENRSGRRAAALAQTQHAAVITTIVCAKLAHQRRAVRREISGLLTAPRRPRLARVRLQLGRMRRRSDAVTA